LPMPREPPVTMAFLPLRLKIPRYVSIDVMV
jgi:hypothetical protein